MIRLEDKTILNNVYEDKIIRELNGIYTLNFKILTNTDIYKKIKIGSIIEANDLIGNLQKFRVVYINDYHKYVRVFCKHIFFDLALNLCNAISVDNKNGSTVINQFKNSLVENNNFVFSSNIALPHTFNIKNKNALDALLKGKHSILGQWGGELFIDNNVIKLNHKIGVDTEHLFTINKNIKSIENEENADKLITRLYLFKTINEENTKKEINVVVDSPLINNYPTVYAYKMDVEDEQIKTESDLSKYGIDKFEKSLIDLPKTSIKIKVTENIKLNLGDTALILFNKYGILKRLQVVKYEYSPISNKLESVEFGNLSTTNLSRVISDKNDETLESKIDSKLTLELAKTVSNLKKLIDYEIENIHDELNTETIKALSNAEIKKHIQSAEGKQELIESITADVTWLKAIIVNTEILNTVVANMDLAKIKKLIVDAAFINSIISKEEFRQQFEDGGADVINIFSKLKDSITQSVNLKIRDSAGKVKKELTSLIEQNASGISSRVESVRSDLTTELSKITQKSNEIELKVDSYKVGGVNLCKDSEFTNADLWVPWALRDKSVRRVPEGNRLLFENLDSSKGSVSCYYNLRDIPFEENKEYVVSLRVKNFRMYPITFYLSGFKDVSRFSLNGYEDTRFFIKGIKTDATNSQLMVVMDSRSNGLDFAVSKLMVEEGNVSTAWSVHPDEKLDVDEVITAINLSKESAKIKAKKIELDGDVVINALNGTSTKISGNKIKAGTIQGSTISGGTINGGTITGSNIRGNYNLFVGKNGYIRPYDDGVLIKVPEEEGSTNGVGVTIKGNGTNSGITIFESRDIFGNATISPTYAKTLLTVGGEINGAFRRNDSAFFGKAVMSNQYKNFPLKPHTDTSKYAYYRVSWVGLFTNSNDGSYNFRFDDGTGTNSLFDVRANATNSDRNLKENIRLCEKKALDVVKRMKFYSFDWKKDKNGVRKKRTDVGVIAQDLQVIDDSFVYESSNGLAVDDFRLLNVALKSIQELMEENKKKDEVIEDLTKRLERLEKLCGK